MSLTDAELRRTSADLTANFDLTGLTLEQVGSDLGFEPARVESTLRLDGATDPVDTWLLRDYLLATVRDAGGARKPHPWSRSGVVARAAAGGPTLTSRRGAAESDVVTAFRRGHRDPRTRANPRRRPPSRRWRKTPRPSCPGLPRGASPWALS